MAYSNYILPMRNYCTIAQMISEYYYETSTVAVRNGMEQRPVTKYTVHEMQKMGEFSKSGL